MNILKEYTIGKFQINLEADKSQANALFNVGFDVEDSGVDFGLVLFRYGIFLTISMEE